MKLVSKLGAALVLMGAAALIPAAAATAKVPLAKTVQVPTAGGGGVIGPDFESGGEARYTTLYGDARGTTLLKINADGGQIERERWFGDPWTLAAVTIKGKAGGLSTDGSTLVLFRPDYSLATKETEFQVLDPDLSTRDRFELNGRYGFDAISPDGSRVYLVEYRDPRDPLDYAIRAFDVDRGRLLPGEIVDPSEPDERMAGMPVSRQMSPDGRWAYTLYAGGEETFVHALDTEGATAVCVDLHEFSSEDAYGLQLAVQTTSGAIDVRQQGRPLASVDPVSFEVSDVDPEPATVGDRGSGDDAGSDWLGAAAIAAGIAMLAGACLLILRRNRRAAA
jgi:hypothetical protein